MALAIEETRESSATGTAAAAVGEVVRGLIASSFVSRGAAAPCRGGLSAALACWVAQCHDIADYFRWKSSAPRPKVVRTEPSTWRSADDNDLVTMLSVMGVRLGV